MLNFPPEHPGASFAATGKVCADPRCATLLDEDAEVCDECAGTRFVSLESIDARLCGWAGERPVVFRLHEDRPSIVGRSTAEQTPDVDLRRFPGSEVVHRRHARIDRPNGQWQVSQLGSNLLAVIRGEPVTVEPGQAAALQTGDALQVGNVVLRFVARPSSGPI